MYEKLLGVFICMNVNYIFRQKRITSFSTFSNLQTFQCEALLKAAKTISSLGNSGKWNRDPIKARGLSRENIESVFGLFTKFNVRKTDSSQNSTWEKRTLHKIPCEKNGLLTNSIWEKRTLPKYNSVHIYVFWRTFFWSQKKTFFFFRSEK